jgi:dCMP deaminase
MANKVQPRETPDRDSKYMGLAWIHAGFSKDPSTQVGAQIVDTNNYPLGSGFNGPPRGMNDSDVIWTRPTKENPDALSKYDLMVHAEINAMEHSYGADLSNATLYVTALPCSKCMLDIVKKRITRVVYFNFQSNKNSMLQKNGQKTFEIARLGDVSLEEFKGNINWVLDWSSNLKQLGIFEM